MASHVRNTPDLSSRALSAGRAERLWPGSQCDSSAHGAGAASASTADRDPSSRFATRALFPAGPGRISSGSAVSRRIRSREGHTSLGPAREPAGDAPAV